MRVSLRTDDTSPQRPLDDAGGPADPSAEAPAPAATDPISDAPPAGASWVAFDAPPPGPSAAQASLPRPSLLTPARRQVAVAPPLVPPPPADPVPPAALERLLAEAGLDPERCEAPADEVDDATLARLFDVLDDAFDADDESGSDGDADGEGEGGRGAQRALAWAEADAVHLGGDGERAWVLGPQPWSRAAQADFFRTLWQQGASVVVALADPAWLAEGSRTSVGGYTLQAGVASPLADTPTGVGRAMRVTCTLAHGPKARTLTVLRLRWPDYAALPPAALAQALDEVQAGLGAGTVAVHCTAGRGRSGTFALAAALRQRRKLAGPASLRQLARTFARLRAQRPGAVETPEQFIAAVRASVTASVVV